MKYSTSRISKLEKKYPICPNDTVEKFPIPEDIGIVFDVKTDTEATLWAAVEYLQRKVSQHPIIIKPAGTLNEKMRAEVEWANRLLGIQHFINVGNVFLAGIIPKGMMDDKEYGILKGLATEVARDEMIMVDIGAWMGRTTIALAQVAKENNGSVYAVDLFNWFGDGIFMAFRESMRNQGYWFNEVFALQMPSSAAARIWADNSVDLVWIDGSHIYDTVYWDIVGWWHKLKIGGIFCGKCANKDHPDVLRALKETLGEGGYFTFPGRCSIWAVRKK